MAENAWNRVNMCEELQQWLDMVTKQHDETIQKARNYSGAEEQARFVSSRSREVVSLKASKNLDVQIGPGYQVKINNLSNF